MYRRLRVVGPLLNYGIGYLYKEEIRDRVNIGRSSVVSSFERENRKCISVRSLKYRGRRVSVYE